MHLYDRLNTTLNNQLLTFTGSNLKVDDFPAILRLAKSRYEFCLSHKRNKHAPSTLVLHSDEYTTFLTFLANTAYINDEVPLATAVYLLNRRLNAFDCFYTRDIPQIFHLVHPICTILGQATYSNYLVVYQAVTVGGDLNLRYPFLHDSVGLFASCRVLGSTVIESNCAVGAGAQLYASKVPADTSVILTPNNGQQHRPLNWSIRERFFRK